SRRSCCSSRRAAGSRRSWPCCGTCAARPAAPPQTSCSSIRTGRRGTSSSAPSCAGCPGCGCTSGTPRRTGASSRRSCRRSARTGRSARRGPAARARCSTTSPSTGGPPVSSTGCAWSVSRPSWPAPTPGRAGASRSPRAASRWTRTGPRRSWWRARRRGRCCRAAAGWASATAASAACAPGGSATCAPARSTARRARSSRRASRPPPARWRSNFERSTTMTITDVDTRSPGARRLESVSDRLTDEDYANIARELDALREEIMSGLGERDAAYIRRVLRWQRGLEVGGRALLLMSSLPPAWVAGTVTLAVAKILENMEIGHNVMHGQWDWMRDPKIHSTTWEWDNVSPADQWKHSHNFIHHTYTNVLGKDNDVGYGILRVAPEQKWSPVHLAQPLYNLLLAMFFEYGVAVHDLE